MLGASLSVFCSILSSKDFSGSNSLFERIVRHKLQIINKVATIAVALVKKLLLDLENI